MKSAALLLGALLVAGCAATGPRSRADAISRAASAWDLRDPAQLIETSSGDRTLAVFVGLSGAREGVGLIVVQATAPWATLLQSEGPASRAEKATLLTSVTGEGGDSSAVYLYGTVT